MTQSDLPDWSRRHFMAGLALFGVAIGSPAQSAVVELQRGQSFAPQQALMRDVAQLVLPRTGTAGAGELGVGSFVLLALAHGLEGAKKPLTDPALEAFKATDGTLDHARWLTAELERRLGGPYLVAPLSSRHAALSALDADAFAGQAAAAPWRTIKALILLGYYTSQTGGSAELRYEHVPGRWDPDVPMTASTRAFSSDWTAVDFG